MTGPPVALGPRAPKHYRIAERDLGLGEIPGPEANPRIADFLKRVGQAPDDEIPWCAAAVNAWLDEAGLEGTGKPNARSFCEWGEEVPSIDDARIGDVVVMKRGSSSWQGHVALFVGLRSDAVLLLGGNQGDVVCKKWYALENVIAIRRAPAAEEGDEA
jgi:uncharacterized protein (TIGR02594 family)